MNVVIVGGGAAADGAVVGLREAGHRGQITILAAEAVPPYERPPLSKAFLQGHLAEERLFLQPPGRYAELGVHLRTGATVVELDLGRRRVRLAEGADVEFDQLLLATGGRPRRLERLRDALYLRTLADAQRLQAAVNGWLTIIGAGFIGCEVAASERSLGRQVLVLEALERPLERVLGRSVGDFVAALHRGNGVELRTGVGSLPALRPPVLVAIGSQPDTDLALAAGLAVDGGILVDELGRTSQGDVWAAGDAARFWSPLWERHVRVEHFQTAWRHGRQVGRNLAGAGEPFAEAPWFWSDQYDLNLQYVGAGLPWDEELVRGEVGRPPFAVFYRSGGRLVAAAGADTARVISHARRVLEAGLNPSREQLEDSAFELRRLLRTDTPP